MKIITEKKQAGGKSQVNMVHPPGRTAALQLRSSNRPFNKDQGPVQQPLGLAQRVQGRALQAMANSRAVGKGVLQMRPAVSSATVVQLVNQLTMHTAPYDTRLAGGGKGSSVNTGDEVQAVIDSGNLQDMKDSRKALSISIKTRIDALNPDQGHSHRIVQEQGWLAQLDAAIQPLEAERIRLYQQSLRPKAPTTTGPGWTPPPGPAWGAKPL